MVGSWKSVHRGQVLEHRRRIASRHEREAGDEADPERDERGVDLAAAEDDVAVAVGHRHGGEHGLDRGPPARRRVQRRDAHVRRAGHADRPVAPRLGHDPVDDLRVVGHRAGAPRVPLPARGAGAPVVDHDRGVPVVGQPRAPAGEGGGTARLAVAGDGERGGERSGAGREGDVGAQHDAVGHGDLLVDQRRPHAGGGRVVGGERRAARGRRCLVLGRCCRRERGDAEGQHEGDEEPDRGRAHPADTRAIPPVRPTPGVWCCDGATPHARV